MPMSNVYTRGFYRRFSFISSLFCKRKKGKYFMDLDFQKNFQSFTSGTKMVELLKNRDYINKNLSNCSNESLSISIGSYNILAQCHLVNNYFLYENCDQKYLDWPIRWINIKKDFENLNCDILCLQEVEIKHYSSDIEPAMLQLGYKGFLSAKSGAKPDGCAIFVKLDKFDYDQSIFETLLFHRDELSVLSTHNVGQIALLSPISNPDSKICVANTHLSFNPNHGEIKLAELSLLLARIDAVSNAHRVSNRESDSYYIPIILCGDFNSEAKSDIIKFITNGSFDFNKSLASEISGQNEQAFWGKRNPSLLSMSELPPRLGISDQMIFSEISTDSSIGTGLFSHNLKLKSVYEYIGEDKSRLVTSYVNSTSCSVDFIFYRNVNCLPRLELVSYLNLLNSEEFSRIGGIPNEYHGSDHIPIVARFRLII